MSHTQNNLECISDVSLPYEHNMPSVVPATKMEIHTGGSAGVRVRTLGLNLEGHLKKWLCLLFVVNLKKRENQPFFP